MVIAKVGTLLHLNLVTSSDIEVVKPHNLPSKYITVTLNFDTSIQTYVTYVIFMLSHLCHFYAISKFRQNIDTLTIELHLALTFIL